MSKIKLFSLSPFILATKSSILSTWIKLWSHSDIGRVCGGLHCMPIFLFFAAIRLGSIKYNFRTVICLVNSHSGAEERSCMVLHYPKSLLDRYKLFTRREILPYKTKMYIENPTSLSLHSLHIGDQASFIINLFLGWDKLGVRSYSGFTDIRGFLRSQLYFFKYCPGPEGHYPSDVTGLWSIYVQFTKVCEKM